MATVNFWSIFDHQLVYTAAHECIHAQLEALSYTDVLRDEAMTCIPRLILRIRAVAVSCVRVTYRFREFCNRFLACFLCRSAQAGDKSLEEVTEPFEHHIVLRDLASGVPGHPRIDDNRQRNIVEGWKREIDTCRSRGNVLDGGELNDVEVHRLANDREGLRRHEEAEDVFGVELASNECASIRYSALDLLRLSKLIVKGQWGTYIF
jgi:hypothetical protein